MSRPNLLPQRPHKCPGWLRRFRYRPSERDLEDDAYRLGQCDGARGEWGRYLGETPSEGRRWAYYWGYKSTDRDG